MAGIYHPFGYTGEPKTCIWCGRKLRVYGGDKGVVFWSSHNRGVDFHRSEGAAERAVPADALVTRRRGDSAGEGGRVYWQRCMPRLGDYGDGFFCTLGCGFTFGRRYAELGKRLEKKED